MPIDNHILDAETRINCALGKIVRYYNFFELNLGLCIRQLENPDQPGRSHAWLAKSSLMDKVTRLGTLLLGGELKDRKEIQEAKIDKLRQSVKETKSIRHYYVHGTWEYLPLRNEAPVGYRIPPWRSESVHGSSEQTMTLEDLEADAEAVKTMFESLLKMRDEYGF